MDWRFYIQLKDGLFSSSELLTEEDGGGFMLTFDLPQSPLLKLNPVLVLAFRSSLTEGDLNVTFTSQSLHPDTQAVCISAGTHYIMLTGKASQGIIHQKWRITIETKSPDMEQKLKETLIGGKSGSNMTSLLLFLSERGTDMSQTPETFCFFCELQRFLGDVLHQDHPERTPVQLASLQSLPPLTLGLSSSETLLAGFLNSSALTVFTFPTQGSVFQVHHAELALSPALLEELRQRLAQSVLRVMGVVREEEMGHRVAERLRRLKELSTLPKDEPAAGELEEEEALQTVTQAYEVERAQRAVRAGPHSTVRGHVCGLRSLTISLETHLVGPNTATINNCHGACSFPLVRANNHAILLNSHIESGNVMERPPCCVPVAYEPLEVVEVNAEGTYLSIKPDVVAKECGCR
ncbi:hypothetical protein LDENG_00189360 [Lucifuga dentata]|nr:hypothetical protein LDENG_00189360 [Lucifuga dentata]